MPPIIAYVKINKQTSLTLRVFVNRKEVLSNFKKTTTLANNDEFDINTLNDVQKSVFEAPVLSSNSIIRLKKPLVKLFLSNKDLNDLVENLRNDLILILYEFSDELVVSQILNKMKIDSSIELFKVTQFVVSKNNLKIKDQNVNIDGLPVHGKSIKKLGKYKYIIDFDDKWGCDIVISDIRLLKSFKRVMDLNRYTLLSNAGSADLLGTKLSHKVADFVGQQPLHPDTQGIDQFGESGEVQRMEAEDDNSDDDDEASEYNYIQGASNSSRLILRSLRKGKAKKSSEEKFAPLILQEENDDGEENNGLSAFDREVEALQKQNAVGASFDDQDSDVKFEASYSYKPIANLGKCIDIHVLKRPKHRRG
ncbi:hypothetical protein ACO0QE_003222 [Hanseniaspora vineae]